MEFWLARGMSFEVTQCTTSMKGYLPLVIEIFAFLQLVDEDFKKTRSDKARRDRLEARNRLKRKAELVSSVSIVSIHLKLLPTKILL